MNREYRPLTVRKLPQKRGDSQPWVQWLFASSTRLILLSFVWVIVLGTALLLLPISKVGPGSATVLQALFTATSATCVTGLVLVDTGTFWSPFGQGVILALIQIGGLGLITLSTSFVVLARRKMHLRTLLTMQESTSAATFVDSRKLVLRIVGLTLTFEGVGALILARYFSSFLPMKQALGWGIFHSVSAFCNAGFDLMGGRTGAFSSLVTLHDQPVFLLTISTLIIFGGLGFAVWTALLLPHTASKDRFHMRVVLCCTAMLLLLGTGAFLFLEWGNTSNLYSMGSLPPSERPLAAWFQATTLRTAGFNSLDQASLTAPSKFIGSILMFIGAGPGSTAGGIKVTTLAALFAAVSAEIHGREYPTLLRRRLRKVVVQKSLVILSMGLAVVLGALMLLCVLEERSLGLGKFAFLDLLYEVVSAFGTVGVSSLGTPNLRPVSQALLVLVMFLGRVGPVAFAISFSWNRKKQKDLILPEGRMELG